MKLQETLIKLFTTIWVMLLVVLSDFFIINDFLFHFKEVEIAQKIQWIIWSPVILGMNIYAVFSIYKLWINQDPKKEESWNKQVDRHLDTTSIIEKHDLNNNSNNQTT